MSVPAVRSPRQITRIDRERAPHTWSADNRAHELGRDKINDAQCGHDVDGLHAYIMTDEVSAAVAAAAADMMQSGPTP